MASNANDIRKGIRTSRISPFAVSPIVNKELGPFSKQLASMLRAGMSLVISLLTIEEQLDNKNFKKVVSAVRETVESGSRTACSAGRRSSTTCT